jgi:NAD dependent epimerase/dehydratase family enzyme
MSRGRQYWPWVHVDDVVGVINTAIVNERLRGPINVAVPGAPRNAEFTQALAEVLHRPAIFPVPKFAGRLMLGSIADDILFSSQRVVPKRLGELPYTFKFPSLRDALKDLLG